jgi:catechol-2,3-dioxygenase
LWWKAQAQIRDINAMEVADMARRKFEPQQGLVLFAKNKKRVSAFYQQTLGLLAVESQASHDLLRGNACEIVVHAIPRKIAASITITRPPTPREQAIFKPTFVVKSLEDVRTAAVKAGGSLKPAAGAWHFRGCTVLDGCDPEGNLVQFKQRDD